MFFFFSPPSLVALIPSLHTRALIVRPFSVALSVASLDLCSGERERKEGSSCLLRRSIFFFEEEEQAKEEKNRVACVIFSPFSFVFSLLEEEKRKSLGSTFLSPLRTNQTHHAAPGGVFSAPCRGRRPGEELWKLHVRARVRERKQKGGDD